MHINLYPMTLTWGLKWIEEREKDRKKDKEKEAGRRLIVDETYVLQVSLVAGLELGVEAYR